MKKKPVSKRLSRILFRTVRMMVRLLSLLIVLLVCAFVFLRIYGVPEPVLKELVKRANAAGIPVNVGRAMLTLRGWKASDVVYYSRHPDDLDPIFEADEVVFSRRRIISGEALSGWEIDIEASEIRINPSVEWGVNIPEGSTGRKIDSLHLSLGIFPDYIEFSNGEMAWLGVDFNVEGRLLKKTEVLDAPEPSADGGRPAEQSTVLPVYVSAEQFQTAEDLLKKFEIAGRAAVDLEFTIDASDYSNSRAEFAVEADQISISNVEFDRMEAFGSYAFPEIRLDKVSVRRDRGTFDLDGVYDLNSKQIQAQIRNTITSRGLLLLAPQFVLDFLVKAQLQFEQLPQFSLSFGPAEGSDLLNAVSGTFSIRDLTYCGLEVESARGKVSRSKKLLNLTQIEATVRGQEERAEAVGSALQGGALQASVYWDADKSWFGVKAHGSMDPNLFLEPLAVVPVATNVIGRFKFPENPPQISLELGSSYVDWHTFFIKVQGMGNQVGFHEGLYTTLNTTAFYSNAVLQLDPIAIMSGVDFMKGTAELDFSKSTVTFDAFGSMSPALLEDAVYPNFNLFGEKIKTSGRSRIQARGIVDWQTMEATDFSAEVESERMEIPIAAVDHFAATVTGKGPLISVSGAAFDLYGGTGTSEFSVQLKPGTAAIPYSAVVNLSGVDFKQCLQFVDLPCRERTAGSLNAAVSLEADMATNFFESANGTGTVAVVDGELTDMPLFSGFSKLMRKVVPGFNTFSITSLHTDFEMRKGELHSPKATFEGDIFSAKASGSFSRKTGFDAKVQVQMLNKKGLGMVIRAITNPIFKLFELRLSGTLSEPTWRLENFTSGS